MPEVEVLGHTLTATCDDKLHLWIDSVEQTHMDSDDSWRVQSEYHVALGNVGSLTQTTYQGLLSWLKSSCNVIVKICTELHMKYVLKYKKASYMLVLLCCF